MCKFDCCKIVSEHQNSLFKKITGGNVYIVVFPFLRNSCVGLLSRDLVWGGGGGDFTDRIPYKSQTRFIVLIPAERKGDYCHQLLSD
jgi:hypothetical protein